MPRRSLQVICTWQLALGPKKAVKRNPTWFDLDPNPHLWFSEFPNSIPSLQDGLLCNSCVIKIRSCSDAYYITFVFRNTYWYSDGVMEYSSKKLKLFIDILTMMT